MRRLRYRRYFQSRHLIHFQRRFPVSFHGSAAANVVAIVWFLAIVVGITRALFKT